MPSVLVNIPIDFWSRQKRIEKKEGVYKLLKTEISSTTPIVSPEETA